MATATHEDANRTPARSEVIRLVAEMLGRAHREAEDAGDPDQARAILRLAHSFADDFEMSTERFARMCFIHTAIDRKH